MQGRKGRTGNGISNSGQFSNIAAAIDDGYDIATEQGMDTFTYVSFTPHILEHS
jgi:hypothetical protein